MKRSRLSRLGMLVAGGWLATGMAWAAAPDEGSRVGGIPRCETELAECTINLTEAEGLLQVCEEALALCEAGQAFPATGQVTCWDSSGAEIDCTGTGHDGEIQAGADLSYTDNGLTITDNNTQLEWMKQDDNDSGDCASFPGYLDKDCIFTWDEAFAFVAQLNTEPCFADACDWRVPNRKELDSILNLENFSPAVSAEFDTGCEAGCAVDECSCTAATFYWSSTSNASNPFNAWDVGFSNGSVLVVNKVNDRRVRAVRGGP